MNTFEAIAARVSVRDFSDAPVEREKIEKIVQAALFAPVGMKRYDSLHLSVLSTHAAVAKFTALAREQCGDPAADPVHTAGALIIVSGKRPDEHTEYANAGCMIENMLLAATELGLGSQLSMVTVGSLVPLLPGVAFTNAIRDIADQDYISGAVRMLDVFLVVVCMAFGVGLVMTLWARLGGVLA